MDGTGTPSIGARGTVRILSDALNVFLALPPIYTDFLNSLKQREV